MRFSITFLLAACGTALVSASGCTGPPCGAFINDNPWASDWLDLGDTTPSRYPCKIWNSGGGPAQSISEVNCTRNFVGVGRKVGGWNNDQLDVDAFRVGVDSRVKKDLIITWDGLPESRTVLWWPDTTIYYFKIHSYETAYCNGWNHAIECNITSILPTKE